MDMDFAKNVGYAFIKEYYGKIGGRSAADLCHMYSKESSFMRYSKDETTKIAAYGVDSIRAHLSNIPKTKFALTCVDCCPSAHGSILISVEGTAMTENSSSDFHQTFIISPNTFSTDTYYIHNDLMRVSVEEAHQPEVAAPAPPAPPSPPAPPAQPSYAQPSPPPVEDIATIEPQVEHEIINNVIDEVMDEKEDTELPVVGLISQSIADREPEQPEEPVQEEQEEEAEPAQEEEEKEEEEVDTAPKSYASVLARMKSAEVKTQVLSGGSVPNAAKKRKEPEKKKPVGDMVALNLISSVRANGKGAKGGKGGKDANNRGQAKRDDEKKFAPHMNSLYIRNLPKNFSDEDCEKVFGVFGKLTGKTIRAAEGFAFIDYDTKASMDKALAQAVTFGSVTLNVQEKKSPAQRAKEKEANRNRANKRVQRN